MAKKTVYIFVLFLCFSIFSLVGCSSRPVGEKDAIKAMQEYINSKYGNLPEIKNAKWVQIKQEDKVVSQGYYAQVTGDEYYIRMDVSENSEYSFRDTGEYPKIEQALKQNLENNPVSNQIKVNLEPVASEGKPEEVWNSLRNAFSNKWNGNLKEFFSQKNISAEPPVVMMAVRAQNRWDFGYNKLAEYAWSKAGELNIHLKTDVFSPLISEQAIKNFNFTSFYAADKDPALVTASVETDGRQSVEPLWPSLGARQQVSVQGFEVTMVDTEFGHQNPLDTNLITMSIKPHEKSVLEHKKSKTNYHILSSVFSVTCKDTKNKKLRIVLDVDAELLSANQADLSGKELVLLSLKKDGGLDKTLNIAEPGTVWAKDTVYRSENKMAYSYLDGKSYFCVAWAEKTE